MKTIGQEVKTKSNFDYLSNHLESLPLPLQSRIYQRMIKKLSV